MTRIRILTPILRRVVAQAGRRLTVTVHEDSPYRDDVTYICAQVTDVVGARVFELPIAAEKIHHVLKEKTR